MVQWMLLVSHGLRVTRLKSWASNFRSYDSSEESLQAKRSLQERDNGSRVNKV
jgi:hypothetical protein